MNALTLFAHYFRIFHRHAGWRLLVLVALVMLMSYAEGVGIALFFPFFAGGAASTQPDLVHRLFRALHLSATPRAVLPVIVVMFLLKGLLYFATVTYSHVLSAELARGARERIVRALRDVDYLYVTGATSGFYANLLTNEVTRRSTAFVFFTHALPAAVNVAIFGLIVLLLDWKLTLAAVAMGLVAVAGFRLPGRIARRYSETLSQENAGLATLLVQSVQAFRYLRATDSFASFQRKVEAAAGRLAHLEVRAGAAGALLVSLLQPLMVLSIAVILFVRLDDDPGRQAPLFVALIYVFRIMNDIYVLQTSWQGFCANSSSVDAVENSVDELRARVERSGTRPFTGLQGSLVCDGLSFGYASDRPVLRDVTLSIPKDSSVALVGESGTGKSTLVDLLIGVLRPTGGRITVDGADLAELALADYRRRVGYVPQDPVIFDDTIANNISLWSETSIDRVRDAARRAHALAFIEASPHGFAARAGERGIQLSGGQRQRIAIARELFRDPDILVLDEATSELDSESERAIQESIDELRGKVTIVMIAHRLSSIRNCDRIYVLDGGRVVEGGTFGDLLARRGSRFRAMGALQGLVPADSMGPL